MQKKKNRDIIFLCQFFYPEYISSATLPFDTAVALSKAGYSVGALCGYPKEYNRVKNVPDKEVVEGIEIQRLKYLQMKRSNFIGRLINYFSFTFSVMAHIGKLRSYKIILVYSNPPILPVVAVIAKKIFRAKIIFVCYDVYPEIAIKSKSISDTGFINFLLKSSNKLIYHYVNKVVTVSKDMAKYLSKNRKIDNRRLSIIPNWYDDKFSSNVIYKPQLNFSNIPDNAFVVSYLGNLGTCQELDTLMGAIRSLKGNDDIYFVFSGHGNKMDLLKKIVEKENLNNVHIYGFLYDEDYNYILSRSNIFVVTLIEGLYGLCAPSKSYSYMMAGRPIIAIIDEKTELAEDLKKHNAGTVIKHGDSKHVEEVIYSLKSDTELYNVMSSNSRKVFLEKYEKGLCTLQYVKLIRKELEV